MTKKILVMADSNEQGNSRMAKLALALVNDPRFEWKGYAELDVDLEFSLDLGFNGYKPKVVFRDNIVKFLCELKEPSDYVASALSPSGHLYQQVLSLRESGHPCMILVLGDDGDVMMAVKDALVTRYRGQELGFQIASYNDRLMDFEANCEALGYPVRRMKTSPWKRLLSTAHKILTGGSLMQYAPRPADGEREITALCMAKGIGPKTAAAIYSDYGSIANLCTATMDDLTIFKQDGRKIGQAKAEAICRLLHGGNLPNKNDIHMRAKA